MWSCFSSSNQSATAETSTCVYDTRIGLISLTWSRHSLRINHHVDPTLSLHVNTKPILFLPRRGTRSIPSKIRAHWDLSRAKYGPGPDPLSGYHVTLSLQGETVLRVGDSDPSSPSISQTIVCRRVNVWGDQVYEARARFGGGTRRVTIECVDDQMLRFGIDGEIALDVDRLKWKFRGNETIVACGVGIQVSWDAYSWVFEGRGRAVFVFKFDGCEDEDDELSCNKNVNKIGLWKRSSSLSSMSSSAGGSWGSSVMEWASTEEIEGPNLGFCLMVCGWKR